MSDIATELNRFAQQMDVDYNYHLKIAYNNKAYVQAIENTCKNNADMAKEILKHTNSFYIKQDDTPRIGSEKDKPYIVCEVCIDDPVVRSEVNLRREMIQYDLISQGFDINELRIIPAKGGMKHRHPFSEKASETHERIKEKQSTDLYNKNYNKTDNMKLKESIENLEKIKRVLCKVLRENASRVIDKINVVTLDYIPTKKTNKEGRSKVFYCLHFYSSDEKVREILKQNKRFIISVAHSLELEVRDVKIHKANDNMRTLKAFPKNSKPVPYFANTNEK